MYYSVYHCITQYIIVLLSISMYYYSVYHCITQYIIVLLSISMYYSVYQCITQYINVLPSISLYYSVYQYIVLPSISLLLGMSSLKCLCIMLCTDMLINAYPMVNITSD